MKYWIGLLAFCVGFVAFGKTPPKPSPKPVPKVQRLDKPWLWEVSGKALKSKSYLLGTIHLGVSEKDLPKHVWAALNRSSGFICEADTMQVDPASVSPFLYFKPPQSLTKIVGEEKTKAIAEAVGAPVQQVKLMRPWFLSSMLILQIEKNPTVSMDKALQEYALKKKKEVTYLETYLQQVKMLAGLDEKEMGQALYEMVTDMKSTRKNYEMMGELYRRGDRKDLEAFTREEMDKIPGMEAVLLQKRNKNWIPILTKAMKKQSTFAAVGLAHLVGKDSVVSLLRKQGYKVTRKLPRKKVKKK